MILDVQPKIFRHKLPFDPHPFVSEAFTSLNALKVDRIVRLVQDLDKVPIGLVAGIRDGVLLSPFSAPFGGFHFKDDDIYPKAIEGFTNELLEYIHNENFTGLQITLPPDIYSQSFNAKVVNTFIRLGLTMSAPEITNWVDLRDFEGACTHPDSRTYYNQSVKNGLKFSLVSDLEEMQLIYNLVADNRARMKRSIRMTFNDLIETSKILPTDYFKVVSLTGKIVAGAIFYRAHKEIPFAVFWGDTVEGRPFRAMDFLTINLWNFYKKLGFRFIDLGISTESGIPNEGLLRFKETHECRSSLRYSFSWVTNE